MKHQDSMHRKALLVGLVLAIGVISFSSISLGNSARLSNLSDTGSVTTVSVVHSATQWSLDEFGPPISLIQATQFVGVLSPPVTLPDNLQLKEIRGSAVLVALIYLTPNLPGIPNWRENIAMLVTIQRDNTYYVPFPAYQVSGHAVMSCTTSGQSQSCTTIAVTVNTVTDQPIRNIVVSGHSGHGWDPQGAYGIGVVTWWANGLHYTVAGDLTMSTLLTVAESMNT